MNTPKPDKIGKYEILDVVGRGGMGVVYRARDARLGRTVAIKMLTEGFSSSADMLRRFYEEANRHASMQHENIVVVFDAGDENGKPYIVMEFVEGQALDKTLKAEERLRAETALPIVEQVCLALGYAHHKGVVHRDVKPANIIVQKNGRVKLIDFGISRDEARADMTLTSTGTLVGTPPYMAPERFRGGSIDGRSDIFSAGVLLYQLLTGRLPFDADYPAVIEQILSLQPPAPSTLMAHGLPSLDAVVSRALAKTPFDRYHSAEEMAMDLRDTGEALTREHVNELMAEAENHYSQREFHAARSALQQLMRLDTQNMGGKRLLAQVQQRLSEQEKERKVQDLTRLAQQTAAEREWERALAFCDEAIGLSPSSVTLKDVRKSIVEGRQTQEKVSQFLQESAFARRKGALTRAQEHAASAQRLDPLNSQIMALCKVLEQEIEEKRRQEELRGFLETAEDHLKAREFEDAASVLRKAASLSPENSDVLRLHYQLQSAVAESRRKSLIRRLEESAALGTTVERLRATAADLAAALKEFPTDSSLLRLRLDLEPRVRLLEEEAFVREECQAAAILSPEAGFARIAEAHRRFPGNEQLASLEATLGERVSRQSRERQLGERLEEATRAIHDRLYLEAIKVLESCQAEGFASEEIDGLLALAKAEGKKQTSQETLDRTYSQTKKLIAQEDYENAIQLLRSVLRQVDEPVLRRQLEEATRLQQATEARADATLEEVEILMRSGLFVEAVTLLKEQSGGVKRSQRIEQALTRARFFSEADTQFSAMTGRAYAQLGSGQSVEELKKVLKSPSAEAVFSQEAIKERLRWRCEETYGEQAGSAIAKARRFLAKDDSQGAEEILQETAPWLELAPLPLQEEIRALLTEAGSGRKILRFKRGSRR